MGGPECLKSGNCFAHRDKSFDFSGRGLMRVINLKPHYLKPHRNHAPPARKHMITHSGIKRHVALHTLNSTSSLWNPRGTGLIRECCVTNVLSLLHDIANDRNSRRTCNVSNVPRPLRNEIATVHAAYRKYRVFHATSQ
jgi:hypothetical protein